MMSMFGLECFQIIVNATRIPPRPTAGQVVRGSRGVIGNEFAWKTVNAYNEDIKIWSEKLIVKFDNKENEIEQLNAENSVKIIKEEITATGDIGLYYPKSEIHNLLGNVEVIENNNYVKCDELYLDIKSSTSIMKSNSSKRVEAYITNN